MGEWHTNLAAVPGEEQAEVAVLPWRGALRTYPDVCMNVSIDGDVHMTVGQARALIEALETVISIVEGTESQS